jgi:hypothetical protein
MGQTTSTSLKALALSVLAAGKSVPCHRTPSAPQGTANDGCKAQNPVAVPSCGSPDCAGCYEVAPGVRIHPPKCGQHYRAWLERWEAKGRVQ